MLLSLSCSLRPLEPTLTLAPSSSQSATTSAPTTPPTPPSTPSPETSLSGLATTRSLERKEQASDSLQENGIRALSWECSVWSEESQIESGGFLPKSQTLALPPPLTFFQSQVVPLLLTAHTLLFLSVRSRPSLFNLYIFFRAFVLCFDTPGLYVFPVYHLCVSPFVSLMNSKRS